VFRRNIEAGNNETGNSLNCSYKAFVLSVVAARRHVWLDEQDSRQVPLGQYLSCVDIRHGIWL